MALSNVPRAATVWAANSPMTTLKKETGLNSRNDFAPERLTEERISLRTTTFTASIGKTFFNEANAPEVRSLNELLQFVSKNGVDPIRNKINKQQGFFNRLFSDESWADWLKDKTPLGTVVDLFCERMTHPTPLKALMDRLDRNVLEVANRDAALLLQSLEQPAKGHKYTRNFDPNFSLSLINGTNGFAFLGANAGEVSGYSVGPAGDVNHDGIADLIVGTHVASPEAGKTHVLFGSTQLSSSINASSLNGANGFTITGTANDNSGWSVNGVGDINGDDIDDFAIGATIVGSATGATYVFFGSNAWNSSISVSSLNGNNGFVINGANPGDLFGNSVSGIGDINGDGKADFAVGAPGAGSGAGKTYVFFGSNAWNSPISASSLNGNNGFVFNGENAGDQSGRSVSGAVDLNHDGIKDFVVGAPGATTSAGKTYGIFGSAAPWSSSINASSLNGANGFVLIGENAGDGSGVSVSGAGDINHDGIDDLVVGASNADSFAGKAYAFFGSTGPLSSPINLSSLNGVSGFAITTNAERTLLGYSVSGAGDLNHDGIGDLVAGAPTTAFTDGKVFVIWGKATWSSSISVDSLNGTNGIVLEGAAGDGIGAPVNRAGDINGDGKADLAVGSPSSNSAAGKTYVIYGEAQNVTGATADARHLVPNWKTTALAVCIVAALSI